MQEITKFLQDAGAFFFTTVENGESRVRPLGFFMAYEDKLYFGVGKQKAVYAQLAANPRFELCALRGGAEWLRLRAKAVFDPRETVKEAAFAALPMLKDLYGAPDGPQLMLFYADGPSAVIADMEGHSRRVEC